MITFIDSYRDQFGVELICRVLRAAIRGFLTSRGYRAARTRPPSDREIRDEQLIADLRTVHRDALVPIDTELVDAIGQQRQRTHDRWCRVRLTVIDYGRVWVFWRSRS
jgi:hypothetical protein